MEIPKMHTDIADNYPGLCCPVGLPSMHWTDLSEPIDIAPRAIGDDGCEQGQRINGYDQCSKCGLWWPCIEEPDMWTESEPGSNVYLADGWWGASVCEPCGMLLVSQPDGAPEAYQLP